ncbi:MAG TPA: DUF6259 domain-containing protein, partial [Clostridia bacterium]|nr:DUF6259 domain-containing protein [Clostridia bacterium]
MITLQNEWIKLCLNEKGALTRLENLKGGCGNVIAAPAEGLFRAVFQNGENWEDVAFANAQDYDIQASGDAATLTVKGLRTRDALHDVTLTMRVALEGERVRFTGSIDSRTDATLNDFFSPCVGKLKPLGRGKRDLLLPEQAGRRYTNICDRVAVDETQNGVSVMSIAYPGMASMSFMMLEDGDQCLYLGSHDALFHAASMSVAGSEEADISLEMDRMVFVKKGEHFELPEGVLMLYQGDWRKGADVYAQWAKTWRKVPESPDWMRDMTGYFLVINKQQYGDELWPYETLPELYDLAKAHGCDTLGLFGWYHTGHDNQYPDLDASPTMGGADALRAQIKAVQAEGGHVTLYYQGHLMDTGSPYYKAVGHRLEGKTRWNTPYLEEYSKYHKSEYLRRYSKKLFATVCPSCTEWHGLMA